MKGFRDFLMRGNLVDLAVAFVIGGAFATLVKAFTDILIEALAKAGGAPNFDSFAPGGMTTVGPFLTALVAFVMIAAVIYFGIVKPYTAVADRLKKEEDEAPAPSSEELLAEIRDLLKGRQL